jgi:hypothetical protein
MGPPMWVKQWFGLLLPQSHPIHRGDLRWRPMTRWLCLLLLVMGVVTPAVVTADGQGAPGLVVYAVPSADGYEVWVWAELASGTDTPVSGLLCDSVSGICRTMTCADSDCGGRLTGLPTGATVVGQMSVTITLSSTQALESGSLPFIRAYVPALELIDVASPDNLLELTLFPESLSADTYVFILATSALPGPPPPAHRLVGRPYSVRASGAITLSDRPMALRLAYDSLWLDGATPHNLSIFAWHPFDQRWEEEGGTLFTDQNHLSTPIHRFTTYALMEVPAWRDTFADDSGLSIANGTSPTPEGGLILKDNVLSGTTISIPITPTTAIASWDRLVFTHTSSATTNLRVDVLSLDDSQVLANVASGASLADLDPAQYPGLKLRATLSSTVAGETPVLDQWQLRWQVAERKVYLPVVMK